MKTSRARRQWALGSALWLLLAGAALGRDLYVDAVLGSDATGDGSQALPYKSLTHALSVGVASGDHLWLAAGLYDGPGNGETFPVAVAEGVSIHGDANGDSILRGVGSAPAQAATLTLTTGSPLGTFWVIENLVFEGPGRATASAGIALTPGKGQGPVILTSRLSGYGAAIAMEYTVVSGPDQSIDSRPFLDGNIFTDNRTAIHLSASMDATTGRVRERTEIYNSFIFGNDTGIRIRASCTGCDPGWVDMRNPILNNTIAGNSGDALVLENTDCTGMASNSPQITNNIFAFNDGHGILQDPCAVPNTVDYNDFWSNAMGGGGPAPTNIFEDPQFVDRARFDFHLAGGSPCIDAGMLLAEPLTDVDGDTRPVDGDGDSIPAFDIGADEYNVVTGLSLLRAVFVSLSPLSPARSSVFPFSAGNPLTPVVKTDLRSGDSDPTPGFLTDPRFPLAFYQHDGSPAVRLLCTKDTPGDTVRFLLQ